MKLRSLTAIALIAALAACSQSEGALPTAPGQTPAGTGAGVPGKTAGMCRVNCGYRASTIYSVGPMLQSDGHTWNATQTISSYAAQGTTGPVVALASSATLTVPVTGTTVSGVMHDQLLRDPNTGYFWYIGRAAGVDRLESCSWNGTNGAPCVPNPVVPGLDIAGPQAIALDPTGRLAVLNQNGSIAVFPAGAGPLSVPALLSAGNPALSGDFPGFVGFDVGGDLWVAAEFGIINGVGTLGVYDEFAPGATGNTAPLKTMASFASASLCPFAINRFGQIWEDCVTSLGYNRLFELDAATGAAIAVIDNPYAQGEQVAFDDFDIYMSDTSNGDVMVMTYPQQIAQQRYGFNHQGGIALQ